MKVTLDDIALEAGVSKATVSYVINGKKRSIGVSAKTTERVREAVDRFGYTPNSAAVALGRRRRRKPRILILSPWLHRSGSQFMTHVTGAVEKMGRKAQIDHGMFEPGSLHKVFDRLAGKPHDALLVMGTDSADDAFLARCKGDRKRSIILLNRRIEGIASIHGNDITGGEQVGTLASRCDWYEDHVFVAERSPSQVVRNRFDGFTSVLQQSGKGKPRFFALEDDRKVSLTSQFSKLQTECGDRKTLFFVSKDAAAISLMTWLTKEGAAVPEQYGVIGYDNDPLASIVYPRLTTVDSGLSEMARSALGLCISTADRDGLPDIVIEPELIIRESVRTAE